MRRTGPHELEVASLDINTFPQFTVGDRDLTNTSGTTLLFRKKEKETSCAMMDRRAQANANINDAARTINASYSSSVALARFPPSLSYLLEDRLGEGIEPL